MTSLHQTECLTSIAAHMECLTVKLTGEGIERAHDVANGAIAVICRVRSFGLICQLKHAWIGLFHHLLAVVNADEVLLKDIVVKHVLSRFTQIDNPLTHCWRLYPIGHVLCIDGAGRVIVAADAADAARDEVCVTGVFALHEEAVASEDMGGAIGLHYFALLKVDLGVDTQTANDAGHGIP